MAIINFTVEYDQLTNESIVTAGEDVGTEALVGYVYFTPQFVDSRPILAPGYLPRPAGLRPRSFSGYIDSDGRLRAERGADDIGVRLWANDPVLGLNSLTYRVTFDLTTPMGEKVRLDGGYLEAPSSDTTIQLAEVLQTTGQPASPITKIAPGGVRIEDGELVFTFGGIDIPDPIPYPVSNSYSATIGTGSATSINVDHNLGTADVVVSVHTVATGEEVDCDVVKSTANRVVLTFATAPALNALRCTVIGSAFGVGAPRPTESISITDATVTGRALITAADAAAARTAIGSTSIGSSLITASSATTARSAIGAVSSADVTAEIASSATIEAAVGDALDGVLDDAGIIHTEPLTGDPTLSFAITDGTSHRSDLELGLDGKLTDRVIESIGDRLGITTATVIPEITDDDRVFLATVATGERTLLGTVTGASSPTLLDSTSVRVETSTGPKWVSTVYSTARPVFPSSDIACWGDSLTYSAAPGGQASPTYPQTVATDLGVTVYNGGIGGNASADIATRQGGLRPLCTLTGNQIPSGSTTPIVLTAISPSTGWRTGGDSYISGSLAGVAGELHNDISESHFTFTPTVAPVSTVSVPAGTPFICDEGVSMRDRINVIWSGHNNAPSATAVTDIPRDIASMVEWLTPYTKRYLVVSVTWELKSRNDQLNAPLIAIYGDKYVDLNGYLITDGLTAAGLTPTADDLADIAAGEIPRQLRYDGTHFTQACTTVIGHYIADQITARNWV